MVQLDLIFFTWNLKTDQNLGNYCFGDSLDEVYEWRKKNFELVKDVKKIKVFISFLDICERAKTKEKCIILTVLMGTSCMRIIKKMFVWTIILSTRTNFVQKKRSNNKISVFRLKGAVNVPYSYQQLYIHCYRSC